MRLFRAEVSCADDNETDYRSKSELYTRCPAVPPSLQRPMRRCSALRQLYNGRIAAHAGSVISFRCFCSTLRGGRALLSAVNRGVKLAHTEAGALD